MTWLYFVPRVRFHYPYMEWVEMLDGGTMRLLCLLLILTGLLVSVGFFTQAALLTYNVIFTYIFLLNRSEYLNHFYLLIVINAMLLVYPLAAGHSVDAWLFPSSSRRPTVPRWTLVLFLAQLAIVYTFAGIVKINADWLRAEPLVHWLGKRAAIHPLLGQELTAYLFSYGGLVYDLTVFPLLLWRRTKLLGVILSCFFHLTNKYIFNIGIFPWMMLASTTLFFHPSWPHMIFFRPPPDPLPAIQPFLFHASKETSRSVPSSSSSSSSSSLVPHFAKRPTQVLRVHRPLSWEKVALITLALLFLAQQVVVPLRSLQYEGDVAWTEYGHLFSWRMKLRDKACEGSFSVELSVSNQTVLYQVSPSEFVTRRTWTRIKSRPDMIVEFAHAISNAYNHLGSGADDKPPRVFANIRCQLNFRPVQQFTNPEVDLSSLRLYDWPYPFIVDLEPFPQEYLEDYPWNMPAQHVIDLLSLNCPFSRNTRQKVLKDDQSNSDYYAHRPPAAGDTRSHVESALFRSP
ncbi:MAG: HTTM domain-containing protein [archaeon]|nr:HTTM domain-containing protein [archaeon]